MKKATIALLVICTAVFAQQKGTGTFTDSRDKKKYKTVNIGGFTWTWMAENLNYNAEGSKCYDNKPANCTKYGRLYDWKTAMKACPEGWRLPALEEWKILQRFADDDEDISMNNDVAGKNLKAKSGWDKNRNESGNGTDKYGFSALPGGHFPNFFNEVGKCGLWWGDKGSIASVCYNADFFSVSSVPAVVPVDRLVSVRCLQGDFTVEEIKAKVDSVKARADSIARADSLKAEAVAEVAAEKAVGKQFNPKIKYGSMTDERDKTTYKTVKIGEQTWMAENLNYDAEGSKCYGDRAVYCKRDGRIYGWETAKTACPAGWHLPSKSEYESLDKAVGNENVAGKKLKAKNGWNKGNGTDDFGFSALPSGNHIIKGGAWWSSSVNEKDSSKAYLRYIPDSNSDIVIWADTSIKNHLGGFLISVRCVQD